MWIGFLSLSVFISEHFWKRAAAESRGVGRSVHRENWRLSYHVLDDAKRRPIREWSVDRCFEGNMFCFDSKWVENRYERVESRREIEYVIHNNTCTEWMSNVTSCSIQRGNWHRDFQREAVKLQDMSWLNPRKGLTKTMSIAALVISSIDSTRYTDIIIQLVDVSWLSRISPKRVGHHR